MFLVHSPPWIDSLCSVITLILSYHVHNPGVDVSSSPALSDVVRAVSEHVGSTLGGVG